MTLASLLAFALLPAAAAAAAEAPAAASADGRGPLAHILAEDDSCAAGSAGCALNVLQYTGGGGSQGRRAAGAGGAPGAGAEKLSAAFLQMAQKVAEVAFHNASAGGGSCITPSLIEKVRHAPLSCSPVPNLMATSSDMPAMFGCHTQGIAVDEASERVVITCEDMTVVSARGRVAMWPRFRAGSMAQTVKGNTGKSFTQFHPSATQMLEQVAPVFFANPAPFGGSTLYFYEARSSGLEGPIGQTIVHPESHMGAAGFAKVAGSYVIVGCGWDCKTFGVWVSSQGLTSGYHRSFYTGSTQSMVTGSRVGSTSVNAYNSLYLTTDCSTGQVYMLGSYDDKLEVWQMYNLLTPHPSMTKIGLRTVEVSNILSEGFTMVPSEDGSDATVFAIPENFHSCAYGKKCASGYTCNFH